MSDRRGLVGPSLSRLALWASGRARAKRRQVFWRLMRPTDQDRILDLGSEGGGHIAALVPYRARVEIADINAEALARGAEQYGFKTQLLDESGSLPIPDGHYDIVFCSSVLEHVTVDKAAVGHIRSRREFERLAFERQRRFAQEVARVGRRYFVQTPYRYFPIESHTWLPAPFVFLPRRLQLPLVAVLNRHWIKTTQLTFHLLTYRQMRELFPDAEIVAERFVGITKSLIAVRN